MVSVDATPTPNTFKISFSTATVCIPSACLSNMLQKYNQKSGNPCSKMGEFECSCTVTKFNNICMAWNAFVEK